MQQSLLRQVDSLSIAFPVPEASWLLVHSDYCLWPEACTEIDVITAISANGHWVFSLPKYERGSATNYITRNKARKKLQLSLADFR